MKIPDLPTENLYKFICFTGLSLIIISPIYYQVFTHQVLLKNMDLKLEMALTKKRVAFLKKDVEFLGSDVEEATKKLEIRKEQVKENPKGPDKEIEKNKVLRLRGMARDVEIEMVKMDRLAEEVFFLNEQHNLLKKFSIIGFVVGSFLFGVGLYFWFTRIQIYEDRIIKKKAQDHQRE